MSSTYRGLGDRGPGSGAAPGCDSPLPHPDHRRLPATPTPCSISRCIGGAGAHHPQLPGTGCHPLLMVAVPPMSLPLPWWHLAVILCPRCPCLQRPFPWSGGTWSPPSALATLCLGRGCSPTTAPPGGTGVPLVWCHGPVLCPSGWVLRHVAGTARLGCGGTDAGDSWCPCPSSMALAAYQMGPCTRDVMVCHIGVPHCGLCLSVPVGPQCQVPGLALPWHSASLTLAATRALAVGGTGCAGYK